MQVLVTGGAGFIGSHLAERLLRDGHSVRILDNLSTGHRSNLSGFDDDIEFVEGDIRDNDLVRRTTKGCDIVFHQAAVVSVPYSVENPQETHDVNIQGTLNVLLAARDLQAKRVIFACSAAVYGDEPSLPKQESMRAQPISPYGLEKLSGEIYGQMFSSLYGLEFVALRYFNIFGPRQDPKSPYSGVISIFVDKILKQQAPTIFGDGEQTRDFVFVENVVQANMLAATRDGVSGETFNVGLGTQTSLNALVQNLAEIRNLKVTPNYAPPREGDIVHSLADVSLARKKLGYDPKISVKEGLRNLVEYEASRNVRPVSSPN